MQSIGKSRVLRMVGAGSLGTNAVPEMPAAPTAEAPSVQGALPFSVSNTLIGSHRVAPTFSLALAVVVTVALALAAPALADPEALATSWYRQADEITSSIRRIEARILAWPAPPPVPQDAEAAPPVVSVRSAAWAWFHTDMLALLTGRGQFNLSNPWLWLTAHAKALSRSADFLSLAPPGQAELDRVDHYVDHAIRELKNRIALIERELVDLGMKRWHEMLLKVDESNVHRLRFFALNDQSLALRHEAPERAADLGAQAQRENRLTTALAEEAERLRQVIIQTHLEAVARAVSTDLLAHASNSAIQIRPKGNGPFCEDTAENTRRRNARQEAILNLRRLERKIEIRIGEWKGNALAVAKAFDLALERYRTASAQGAQEEALEEAVAFGLLTTVSVGALSWISTSAQASGSLTAFSKLVNGLEDAVQAGLSEGIDVVQQTLAAPDAGPEDIGSPLRFKTTLEQGLNALELAVKRYIDTVEEQLLRERWCSWDAYDEAEQLRGHEAWLTSLVPAVADLPPESAMADVFEKGFWAAWLRHLESFILLPPQFPSAVAERLNALGISGEVAATGAPLQTTLTGVPNFAAFWDWAKGHRPKPILELPRAEGR